MVSDGGWASGDWGGSSMGSDVATTAMAVMALAREAGSGSAHAANIRRGTEFVVKAVRTSDPHSPRLNTPQGTQPQVKLGQLVDTHLAALMLGQVGGRFDAELNGEVAWALDYVVGKVQQAQRADGSFDGEGWAPVLSSSLAAMSLYQAADQGIEVKEDVLRRSERYQASNVAADGAVNTSAGAGVDLYVAASSLRNGQSAAGRAAPTAKEAEASAKAVEQRVARDAQALISGFGSVGGEEMLSYMMISEAMAQKGGAEWSQWEQQVSALLQQTQNADGSWSGHHCITSTPFVTAGALLTLSAGDALATRSPAPRDRRGDRPTPADPASTPVDPASTPATLVEEG